MADTHYIQWKTDTQEPIKMRVVDNGDGTYSLATAVTARSVAFVRLHEGLNIAVGAWEQSPYPLTDNSTYERMTLHIIPVAARKLKVMVDWYGDSEGAVLASESVLLDGSTVMPATGYSVDLPVMAPYCDILIENTDTQSATVDVSVYLKA